MADEDAFVKVKLKLTAYIGGTEFDDVVSMSATFGLNSIPTASIVVAVGEDPNRQKLATIHTARPNLQPRDIVRVFVEMIPESGRTEKIPGQKYKVFEGYLSGIGYQRSHNSANYTINVVHWIDDLNNSGALTGNWFPGAQYDLAQSAMYNALQEGGGMPVPVPLLDPTHKHTKISNITADLWLQTLSPIYKELASWAYGRQQALPGSGHLLGTNSAAIGIGEGVIPPGALNRMPGTGAGYYRPLALRAGGLQGPEFDAALRHGLQVENVNSYKYTTFWSKLVGEIAPQFFFAISPAVDWALPIPFFAALSAEYKTIKADEYSYANFNANMAQLLESVDIFYPVGCNPTGSGGMGVIGRAFGMEKPLGTYEGVSKRGLRLYKEPPAWLTNPAAWYTKSAASTGEGGPLPGDQAVPNRGAKSAPTRDPGAVMSMLKGSKFLSYLAEHWYKSELLYQRYGEMSGYLRFDIAPGSIVKIETPPKDREWYGGVDAYMFATVTQVSYSINAERAMAGTSFSLAHIRTEEENNNPKITSAFPPMYTSRWRGGPLADPI